MTDERSAFQKTTSEITLDLPAAVCISSALDEELARIERNLKRARASAHTERGRARVERLENQRANFQAAKAAFDPAYKASLAAGLYTPEHNALIAEAAAS